LPEYENIEEPGDERESENIPSDNEEEITEEILDFSYELCSDEESDGEVNEGEEVEWEEGDKSDEESNDSVTASEVEE
jgi:hypothetical protein